MKQKMKNKFLVLATKIVNLQASIEERELTLQEEISRHNMILNEMNSKMERERSEREDELIALKLHHNKNIELLQEEISLTKRDYIK